MDAGGRATQEQLPRMGVKNPVFTRIIGTQGDSKNFKLSHYRIIHHLAAWHSAV